MMYIDHHISAKDVLVVTNKAARKDLRDYFVGFGQVQNNRAWIPDAQVLNRSWLDEIVDEE
eukprot:13578762-Ditylum_brightwellii.AAC.1